MSQVLRASGPPRLPPRACSSGLLYVLRRPELRQFDGGECPGQGLQDLGRELTAHDLFHAGALVAELDVLDLAFLVAIFKIP